MHHLQKGSRDERRLPREKVNRRKENTNRNLCVQTTRPYPFDNWWPKKVKKGKGEKTTPVGHEALILIPRILSHCTTEQTVALLYLFESIVIS